MYVDCLIDCIVKQKEILRDKRIQLTVLPLYTVRVHLEKIERSWVKNADIFCNIRYIKLIHLIHYIKKKDLINMEYSCCILHSFSV